MKEYLFKHESFSKFKINYEGFCGYLILCQLFQALSVLLCAVIANAEEAVPQSLELAVESSSPSTLKKQEKRGVYAGGYPTGAGYGYEQPLGYYGAASGYNNPAYNPAIGYNGGAGYYGGYNAGLGYNGVGYNAGLGYNPAVGYSGGALPYNPAYGGYSGYSGYPSNRVIGLGE